jgi:hypothetical protein
MKRFTVLLPLVALCGSHLLAGEPAAMLREPCQVACKLSSDLFWIADTGKMDTLLANIDFGGVRTGAYRGEVLPDTRVVWRDYAREARSLSGLGRESEAAARIAQMLKLAAVYRSFGGLQNVVQGEEIRYLAGQIAAEIGCTEGVIQSPYLEKTSAQSVAFMEQQIGAEKSGITTSFWTQLKKRSQVAHARLSGNRPTLAATP